MINGDVGSSSVCFNCFISDISSNQESNRFYWYIGVISTNGETLGLLIDANTSEIIAKKV